MGNIIKIILNNENIEIDEMSISELLIKNKLLPDKISVYVNGNQLEKENFSYQIKENDLIDTFLMVDGG